MSNSQSGFPEDAAPTIVDQGSISSSIPPPRPNYYYDMAESDTEIHWRTIIEPVLRWHSVDYGRTLDFAAGHGRFSAKFADVAKHITTVDTDPGNIQFCRDRFSGNPAFTYICNDGSTLQGIPDKSISFFFTFDAMVLFDMQTVQCYIKEAFRVLEPGSQGFFHYSNYDRVPGGDFQVNPHCRNFMSKSLFEHLAFGAGFFIVHSSTISWGGILDLDGIALLRKPLRAWL